jgi:hypothetical protein
MPTVTTTRQRLDVCNSAGTRHFDNSVHGRDLPSRTMELLIELDLIAMERLYRIEIDVLLDDRMRSKVIQAARDDYRNGDAVFAVENGENVEMTAEEFVVDTKTAFLEIAESGFRTILPDIEPHRFSCGIEKGIAVNPLVRVGRSCRPRRVCK